MKFLRILFVIPALIAAIAWISTILTLLIIWLEASRPKYETDSPNVSFISTIGSVHKPVFVIGASITAAFFVVTLILFIFRNEKRARLHSSQVNGNGNQPFSKRLWADVLALVFGIIGSTFLVLLTVLDSMHHSTFHWISTLIFAFSVILCAIFNVVGLSSFRRFHRSVYISYFLKILFIVLAALTLIGMISLMYSCSSHGETLVGECMTLETTAAILEWILALLFFVFLLTWVIDFGWN